jgi:hypothetical protein
MSRAKRLLLLLVGIAVVGCGGSSAGSSSEGPVTGTPRVGPPLDLIALVPSNAVVVLHGDLSTVRQDPAMYERLASELVGELSEMGGSSEMRMLLDRSDEFVGVFVPGADGGQQEGMLIFSGRFTPEDFAHAVQVASSRHGSPVTPTAGGEGRQIVELGRATLVQLDTWTWAVVQGPQLRAHMTSVALRGSRSFSQNLIEFGPRIGLPPGSAQAWADQNAEVGADMVALVFAGENPQMVQNFVGTVRRHLGL